LVIVRPNPWRPILQVGGKDGLGSIDHEEGCEVCRLAQGHYQTLEDHKEICDPSAAKLVQPVEDPRFEALQDHVVGALDLPVRLGVHHGCPIHADMVIIT
jgi:hypothetical protein